MENVKDSARQIDNSSNSSTFAVNDPNGSRFLPSALSSR
jgi:hypothetical protein